MAGLDDLRGAVWSPAEACGAEAEAEAEGASAKGEEPGGFTFAGLLEVCSTTAAGDGT